MPSAATAAVHSLLLWRSWEHPPVTICGRVKPCSTVLQLSLSTATTAETATATPRIAPNCWSDGPQDKCFIRPFLHRLPCHTNWLNPPKHTGTFVLMPNFHQVGPVLKTWVFSLQSYAQAQLSRHLELAREFLGLENIQQASHQSPPALLKQGSGCTSPGKTGKSQSRVRPHQDETVSRGPSQFFNFSRKGGTEEETPSYLQPKN